MSLRYWNVLPARTATVLRWAAAVLCILALFALGTFRPLNGHLYDTLVRWSLRTPPSAVLLVEVDEVDLGAADAVWEAVHRHLRELGARQVVFTFLPPGASEDFYRRAAQEGAILFGRRLSSPDPPGPSRLETPAAGAAGAEPATGVVALPPPVHGVYRVHFPFHSVGGETLPSLELLAATGHRQGNSAPTSPFWIDFAGGVSRLPRVEMARALSGDLVASLVEGRTVLVGLAGPRLAVPGTAPEETISELQFRGFALDTLISGRPVVVFGFWATLAAVLAVALVSIVFLQVFDVRLAGWATFFLLLSHGVLAWFLLSSFRIWLPLAEMLTLQVALLLILITRRAELKAAALRHSALETSARLQDRLFPPGILTLEDCWAQVITLVDQALHLNRLIFLEKVPGDHRVREVKALRCSLGDVAERRRDYERTPYSTAIAAGRPLALGDYRYLSGATATERQYLVPLTFGGEVLGFWGFGVEPENLAGRGDFEDSVRLFAAEIGELLYQRQQMAARERSSGIPLLSYLTMENEGEAGRALQQSVVLLERRLIALENVFAGLETAMILYDLFGRVLFANRAMSATLQRWGVKAYEMTALDFIREVAVREEGEARRILEKVLLEEEDAVLPAAHPGAGHREFRLRIHPLRLKRELASLDEGNTYPFRLQGILCELSDLTEALGENGPELSLQELVEEAAGRLREEASQRRITFALNLAEGTSSWTAPPAFLDVVTAVFTFLVEDAAEQTEIRVIHRPDPVFHTLECENTGFGLPLERLRSCLEEEMSLGSSGLRNLRKAARLVRSWGGRIEPGSQVGVGSRFVLQVPRQSDRKAFVSVPP